MLPGVAPREDDELPELLRRESRGFAERLRRLTPERWAGASALDGWTRAALVGHTAAVLAAESRAVEGLPPHPSPTPQADAALPDVLLVCADDLARACARAGAEAPAARGLLEVLGHRAHVLGDEVPPRLTARAGRVLGLPPTAGAADVCPMGRA